MTFQTPARFTKTIATAIALTMGGCVSFTTIDNPAPSAARQVASYERFNEPVMLDRNAYDEATRYMRRIALLDDAGPQLNAVIAVNPNAAQDANMAQMAGLPLAGRTVLVKDNIETRELPTTAGSLALAGNMTGRDAPLIANMRRAGAVVLGKTNLSEWANIRDNDSTSGWSAVGGLVKNPHATDRNSCGSSSGSGAAVAAGFAWAAIGTETNGSITCPASMNGVVGFKPSVGVISRRHIVPISSTQDTAGPMARSVKDAAMLLGAMAGPDEEDSITLSPRIDRNTDYASGLDTASLGGMRIGVMRRQTGDDPRVAAVFETALADMERAGAVLVDIEFEPDAAMYGASYGVLLYELREEMGKYLRSIPDIEGRDTPRSLADLIAFNTANADRELRWFGQSIFIDADAKTDADQYRKDRATALRLAGPETTETLMEQHNVALLVAPTRGPAWVSDLVNGDAFNGSIGFGSPAAIAGSPHLTVPMGHVEGLPVGLSLLGAKWDDHTVLKAGAAYERARSADLPEPTYQPWRSDAGSN
ncbi:Amidase [Alteripontixanthobacter maritimus]|uniref:Amidase n=1 Tax=Alteripontixanthobacter maritimus TaxID=2161824 RepID=A0A369Q7T4_9SPHN|nr:amidase [Alteripontixanthobacter maritimus]RDC59236.1 Amidase [Alteripontixanthobacter maritimus]